MSDEVNPMFVPKRRFPEFKEIGSWQPVPLNLLAVRSKQKNRDEKIVRVLTNSAEFGVVDQRDFFDKDIATQGNLENYYVVELGSYVYNPRISSTAPVGPISKNKIGTGVMSPLYTVFKFKDQSSDFYEHYFKTTGWHGYLRQASSTGARHDRMAISSEDFMAMPLPVSTPNEQLKIADCLRTLDELIAAQGRKVEKLKIHKKGLMQQLFPREGRTQPRLRFPEFNKSEGWSVKSFHKLFSIGSGRDYKHLSKGSVPVYGSGGYMLSVDDFLYDGESVCIGRKGTINNPMFLTGKFWTVDTLFYTHSFQQCLPKFVYAIFQNIEWLKHNEAGGVPSLSKTIIEKIHTSIPSMAEQQKIADCLTSLDTLITAATQELETFKTHKKGLMQQLFPSMESST